MAAPTTTKRKCPACEKDFEQVEYFAHTQDEILRQLITLNMIMVDVKDVLELTYSYLGDPDTNNGEDTPTENVDDEILIEDGGTDTTIAAVNTELPAVVAAETPKQTTTAEKKKIMSDEEFNKIMQTIKDKVQQS